MTPLLLPLLLSLPLLITSEFCQKEGCPTRQVTVDTKLGQIVGQVELLPALNNEVNVFKGIPFAKKPIGDLRFQDPVQVDTPWTQPLKALNFGPNCPQSKSKVKSEDCLYLNIWAPSNSSSGPKPVMVFIHGGSFQMGSGSHKSGLALAALGDVVVVAMNYRLGFFGFFHSEGVGNNMGMKDQMMALRWVNESIGSFGGDPNEITLFGHSAGGISVGMHLLSPLSAQLFKRSIIESGTPYSFLRPDSLKIASAKSLDMSKSLGCSNSDDGKVTAEALECLKNLDMETILTFGSKEEMHSLILPNPIYGDDFFPKRADAAMTANSDVNFGNTKPTIIGFERDEGETFVRRRLYDVLKIQSEKEISAKDIRPLVRRLFNGKLTADEQEAVIDYYFATAETSTSEELKQGLFQAYGDVYIYCPSLFYATSYSSLNDQTSKLFMYSLEVKSSVPERTDGKGVGHGEELPYVFGQPFLKPKKHTEQDQVISRLVIEAWTSFARTGEVPTWTSFDSGRQVYNMIDASGLKTDANTKFGNCNKLWRKIFDSR